MSRLFTPYGTVDIVLHAIVMLSCIIALLWLRRWSLVFALLILPGTLAHELLHFLVGWVTGAKPVSLTVLPRRKSEGGWILGSVTFAHLRWWNSAAVGLAPLALVPVGAYLFFESIAMPLQSMQGSIIKFGAVQCLIAGWPSPRDWSHAMIGLLAIGIPFLIVFLLLR